MLRMSYNRDVKSAPSKDGERRILSEPFTIVWTGNNGDLLRATIPVDGRGFEISAPKPVLAPMLIFSDQYCLEAVSAAHDYFYRHKGKVKHERLVDGTWEPQEELSRTDADLVMWSNKDDPFWLGSLALHYTDLLGYFAWHNIIVEKV